MRNWNSISGWNMKNNKRVEFGVALLLGLLPTFSLAGPAEDVPPSLELLEFLGSWENPEGEWVDPLQLAEDMDTTPDKEMTEEERGND